MRTLATPLLALVIGCSRVDDVACECEDPGAHGARQCRGDDCGPCMCLRPVAVGEDPVFAQNFAVSPGEALDWAAIDAALAGGPVRVAFAPGVYPDRLDVLRGDPGPHRLLLDGGGAVVPGILTPYEDVPRSFVTVRGFEVTGSADKGIFWRAGDDVILEGNVVHDNAGTPAISLDYANRSGWRSSSFVVRNNHVFNQRGECVYIGGSEGEDQDAHARVEIVANLVHGCVSAVSPQSDGINVKDRIADVIVEGNVVFDTHWGIEVASPGTIAHNLVFDTESDGLHLADQWGEGLSGVRVLDNAVLRAGERGVRVGADRLGAHDVVFDGLTVAGARDAAVVWAGAIGVEARLDRAVLTDSPVALDGWGTVTLDVGACRLDGVDQNDAGALAGAAGPCTSGAPGFGDLTAPAGPDGVFFTDDDPWLVDGGATR